jgi:hypothetical protein
VIAEQFIRQRGLQRQTDGDAYSTEPFHFYLFLSGRGSAKHNKNRSLPYI